jgi:hypothetical protein
VLAPIPYFDLAGYKRRSKHVPTDLDLIESLYPGFIAHRIAVESSKINARLHKRYHTPLGQYAPLLVAMGTLPPAVALSGRPVVGSLEMAIQVTTPGVLGVAVVQWSSDGGQTWVTGVATAATVVLGATGLSAQFPTGTYSADNLYAAGTPIPEIALGWLASIVDVDVWQRRGTNPQDPGIETFVADRDASLGEIKEAADSKDGLFDLPTNDPVGDSAISQAGPISYSETSPYAWQDLQRAAAVGDDRAQSGDFGSADT